MTIIKLFCRHNVWLLEVTTNHGRVCQLYLNEIYKKRISCQPSIQSSQQILEFEQSEIYPHNMDTESEIQSCEDVRNDVIG